jgi:hypothetical protein
MIDLRCDVKRMSMWRRIGGDMDLGKSWVMGNAIQGSCWKVGKVVEA